MSATNFHSLLYEYYTAIARFSSDGCAFPRGQKELPREAVKTITDRY